MKKFVFTTLALTVLSTTAFANSSSLNLQLPNAQGNYSSDKFKAGDLDCQNAIGGSTNLEFGVTGIIDNYQSPFDNNATVGNSTKDIGVYARITVPLDGPKERINCNTLYQLELKKKRLEVLKLEQELKKLRELQSQSKKGLEK
jgi:hypothetical protein